MQELDRFERIYLVDTEFYQDENLKSVPVCLVAKELRTQEVIRYWLYEGTTPEPPFISDKKSVYIAYNNVAEYSVHQALGWGRPANALDLYVEFRNQTNGYTLESRKFTTALEYFRIPWQGDDKEDMYRLILAGGPYSAEQKRSIVQYCSQDVAALERLFIRMLCNINIGQALIRGRYMWSVSCMENLGVPVDTAVLSRLKENWESIKLNLIAEVSREFDVYRGTTFKTNKFEQVLIDRDIPWPRTVTGSLELKDDTFKMMCKKYPELQPLRDLRYILGQLKLNALRIGADGRNRTSLFPFTSKTSRNQPSNTKFIFGPATWLRSLIKPLEGKALAYIDWAQQEYGIAAALSRDGKMMEAYSSGDPYLQFAKDAGAVPLDATKATHSKEREIYKACVLAITYGMGPESLAFRIGEIPRTARRLLNSHKETYTKFWNWSDCCVNHAMLRNELETVFGWNLKVTPEARNLRSLRNFPCQANGAEILRIACIWLVEAGINVIAPVHDAVMIEANIADIEEVVVQAQDIMRMASSVVLGGFELRSDAEFIKYPDRFRDPRGQDTWNSVVNIVDRLEGDSFAYRRRQKQESI